MICIAIHNENLAGAAYDQEYCWVCRMSEGKIEQAVEYADTLLVERVIGGPERAPLSA